MAIQLGRWDCPVCGQIGILGNLTACPSCAAPRGKDVEFYLPQDAQDLTDENSIKEAAAGVDWLCNYCGSDNKATATHCKSCGNERDKDDVNRQEKKYSLDEVPATGQKKKKVQPITPVPAKTSGFSTGKKVLLGLGIFIMIITFVMWPRSFTVEVVQHTWERSIEIENNRLMTEEDWSVPATGTIINSFRAIHHYDQVFDHNETRTRTVREVVGSERYKCGSVSKGNGYFEDEYCDRDVYGNKTESYTEAVYRNVPVYQTKYKYTIYRWKKDHDIDKKGSDKNAEWPKEKLKNEFWREGKKTEKYTLLFKDNKGKTYNEVVDYNLWTQINDNQELKAKKNSMGVFYGIDKEQLK